MNPKKLNKNGGKYKWKTNKQQNYLDVTIAEKKNNAKKLFIINSETWFLSAKNVKKETVEKCIRLFANR